MVDQFPAFNFPLTGGLNTKVDPYQLTPSNLLRCENTRFITQGLVQKRPGFLPLSRQVQTGTQIINGQAIATFNQELLAFDGSQIYTQMASTNQWLSRGSAFSVTNSLQNIVRTQTGNQSNVDGTSLTDGYGNGIEVYTWEDDRNLGETRYTVIDSVTRSYVQSDKFLITGANSPKPIANTSTNLVTIYYTALDKFILSNKVDPTRPNLLGSQTQVVGDGYNDGATGFVYDVVPTAKYDNVIAYNSSLNGIRLRYGVGDGYYANVSPTIQKVSCISLLNYGSPDVFYILYSSETGEGAGPGVYLTSYNLSTHTVLLSPTLLNLSAIANIASTCTIINHPVIQNNFYCCFELPGANGNTLTIDLVTDKGKTIASDTVLNIGLASRGFIYNRDAFITCAYQSPQQYQNTYYVRALTQPNYPVVCKMNDKLGGGYRTNGSVSQCDKTFSGFLLASNRTSAFITSNNTSYSTKGLSASYFSFNHLNSFNSLVASNNLLITGGILQSYDGDSVVENNFHYYPEFSASYNPTINTSGGSIGLGTYNYHFTYEWTDQEGQVQISTPDETAPSVHITTAGSTVLWEVPTLRLSSKINPRSPVSIVMYRTQANSQIFYKVRSVVNNALVDTQPILDTFSDFEIGANAPIYTESQVANSVPPSCSMICEFGNRVVIAGLEDENTLWFSQNKYDLSNFNNVPMEFSDLFTIGVTSATGPITAIARLDDKLIIFKESAIYYINGTGPQPLATGDQFPPPVLLVSDTGCDNENSIVFCPAGLLFKSSKGIYLLDRSTNVSYIGSPVEQYNNLTITSAELLSMTNEVVFTTAEGTVLVWNYFFNQPQGIWSIWNYLPSTDSVIWGGQLHLIQQNGKVIYQDDNTWIDDTLPYSMVIQTPWIGQLQGYQMAYYATLLMNQFGPHNLNYVVEINYVDGNITDIASINSNVISNTWGRAPTWGAGSWGNGNMIQYPYQYKIQFSHPMCQSVRITLSDMQNSNYNAAFSLSNLSFYIQPLTGPARIPAAQSF
jgi:hypothetical protein